MKDPRNMADQSEDIMKSNRKKDKQSASHNQSLLTQEEQEALKPKDVKVENPWIYEQTHQEYLDQVKVSV